MRRQTPVRIVAWARQMRPWWTLIAALVAVTAIVGGWSARDYGDARAPALASGRAATATASRAATVAIGTLAGPSASAWTAASILVSASPSPTAATSPLDSASPSAQLPSPAPPAADIAAALASQASWAAYTSTDYKFTIGYPADWVVSESSPSGWATFRGSDDSNISVTWRAVPTESTLNQITGEVWQGLEDNGYTVESSHPTTIAGLPARVLTANGRSTFGHLRHGIVGVLVTAGGRYRVELWSNPGTEADDLTLFRDLVSTFVPA
jgi:hypothetical protein